MTGVTAATALTYAAIASTVVSTVKTLTAPKPPQAAALAPPPQAAKAPEHAAVRKGMLPGGGDGTALTGPGGVPDDKLILGGASALGG